MKISALAATPKEFARPVALPVVPRADGGWLWLDVVLEDHDTADDLEDAIADLDLDALSIHDAVSDLDIPKVDDFGDHLLVVLHGLSMTEVETYEIDCFVTQNALVTVRRSESPSIDALRTHVCTSLELSDGGPDQLLARVFDVVSRRFLGIVDELDRQVDQLTDMALEADPDFLVELTALRSQAADIRNILRPQREVADQLRRSRSTLLTDQGRRRFSDVYDVVERTVLEFEAARSAMADALGAYQGAEARKATDVTKVLTLYAAVMLPLSLIAGIFGMNVDGLPGRTNDDGFLWVSALMAVVAIFSLAVFGAAGWTRRMSSRRAARRIGKGLLTAIRAPVVVVGAVYEVSTNPIRVARERKRSHDHSDA